MKIPNDSITPGDIVPEANLSDADLSNANLSHADLRGADVATAKLNETTIEHQGEETYATKQTLHDLGAIIHPSRGDD